MTKPRLKITDKQRLDWLSGRNYIELDKERFWFRLRAGQGDYMARIPLKLLNVKTKNK